MSRSIERTETQQRALHQARELHDELKAHRFPEDKYRYDTAVSGLRKLLERAEASPEDLDTTEIELQKLDFTLCHIGIETWVEQLRKDTTPGRPLNVGTAIIAELLTIFTHWERLDPTLAKTSHEEITDLIRLARLKLDAHNKQVEQNSLLMAIKAKDGARKNRHHGHRKSR